MCTQNIRIGMGDPFNGGRWSPKLKIVTWPSEWREHVWVYCFCFYINVRVLVFKCASNGLPIRIISSKVVKKQTKYIPHWMNAFISCIFDVWSNAFWEVVTTTVKLTRDCWTVTYTYLGNKDLKQLWLQLVLCKNPLSLL